MMRMIDKNEGVKSGMTDRERKEQMREMEKKREAKELEKMIAKANKLQEKLT